MQIERKRRFLALWLPGILWAVLIVTLTSIPGSALPKAPFSHFDLLVHAGLYGGLGFLVWRAIALATPYGRSRAALALTYLGGQLFGLLDEAHQIWIPFRSFAPTDIAADGLGVILGILACRVWLRLRG